MRTLYVYILASATRVLYVGVTNNMYRRMAEHRAARETFAGRYRAYRLVYVEAVSGPRAAIAREKQIKGWLRARKVVLIESVNPKWLDLARGWPTLADIARSS
jgi:putative endonuclease